MKILNCLVLLGLFLSITNCTKGSLDTLGASLNAGTPSPTSTVAPGASPTPINHAPIAAALSRTLLEDSILTDSLSGTDSDGDSLTFQLVSNATKGTVNVSSNGAFTYTPSPNTNGIDSFAFSVNDGHGLTSLPATVSLNVTPVNDSPVASNSSVSTNEDINTSGQLVAQDVDSINLTYQLVGTASHGTVTISSTGAFQYAPVANYNGSDSFTFKVSDGSLFSNTGTVSVTVNPINDIPSIQVQPVTVNEDELYTGQMVATDVDTSTLTFSLVGNPTHGTMNMNSSGSFTYRSFTNYNGSDSFSVQVSDGITTSTAIGIGITVIPVNDQPIGLNFSASFFVGQSRQYDLSANCYDIENTPMSFAMSQSPNKGTANVTGSILTYTATAAGSDSLQFTCRDSSLTSIPATLTLTNTNPAKLLLATDSGGINIISTVDAGTLSSPDGSKTYYLKNTGPVSATSVSVNATSAESPNPFFARQGVSTLAASESTYLAISAATQANNVVKNGQVEVSYYNGYQAVTDIYPVTALFVPRPLSRDYSFANGDLRPTPMLPKNGGSISAQSNGRVLVGADNIVFGYLTNGNLDTSFAYSGYIELPSHLSPFVIDRVRVKSNDKIIVAGRYSGSPTVYQLKSDGTPDTSVSTNGAFESGILTDPVDLKIASDGSPIMLAGNQVFKYSSTSLSKNTSFGTSGIKNLETPSFWSPLKRVSFTLLPDNGFVISRYGINSLGKNVTVLQKYSVNGVLDTTFGASGFLEVTDSQYYSLQANDITLHKGKIFFVGQAWRNVDAYYFDVMVRINLDGTLDSTFGSGGKLFLREAHFKRVQIAADNSIYIGEGFDPSVDSGNSTSYSIYHYTENGASVSAGTISYINTLWSRYLICNDFVILPNGRPALATTLSYYHPQSANPDEAHAFILWP